MEERRVRPRQRPGGRLPRPDAVPLERALAVVAHLLARGTPLPDAPWSVDR
ncbi:hypothetical protein [Kitasatospora sp. NPDC004272]